MHGKERKKVINRSMVVRHNISCVIHNVDFDQMQTRHNKLRQRNKKSVGNNNMNSG